MRKITVFIVILAIIVGAVCLFVINRKGDQMKITSGVFENNGNIPSKYTCDGKNICIPTSSRNKIMQPVIFQAAYIFGKEDLQGGLSARLRTQVYLNYG